MAEKETKLRRKGYLYANLNLPAKEGTLLCDGNATPEKARSWDIVG